jgi:hypothetical protein
MKELLIRRKLDEIDDDLVRLATKCVADTGIAGKQNGKEIMQDKQLRNVIAVADDTESVPVVENFIKYQIGRHDQWRHQAFGEKLLDDLRTLQERAGKLADDNITAKDLAIRLARRYLGYLMRHFVYVQNTQ